MPEIDDAYQWTGRTVCGSDGEKLGKIAQIYEDPSTGNPEWATVSSGLFGTRSTFVPLLGASRDGDDIRAQVTKAQVRDAPGVDDDDDLSEGEERRLFEHYGVPHAGEAAGGDAVDASPDVTSRPEPAAGVGGGQPEGGRRRLRRYVVTEVTTTVPVSDEETEISGGATDTTGR